jgi:hypothetical protein
LYLNGGVLLSALAIAAPGIIGSMTRETSFIMSRRFMLNLVFKDVDERQESGSCGTGTTTAIDCFSRPRLT